MLNGVEVARLEERAGKSALPVNLPLKLREGQNTIVVTATDTAGMTQQEVRSVAFERAVPLTVQVRHPEDRARVNDQSSLVATSRRELWAVVIGVGQYNSTAIPQLKYSVADAEAFHEVLISKGGFKKENVLLITDKTARKPTLRDLKWALGTFLARSAKKEDLILIFFAGHGAPEIDPRGAEPDGLAKYLVPSDADPNDLYSTGLPMD